MGLVWSLFIYHLLTHVHIVTRTVCTPKCHVYKENLIDLIDLLIMIVAL